MSVRLGGDERPIDLARAGRRLASRIDVVVDRWRLRSQGLRVVTRDGGGPVPRPPGGGGHDTVGMRGATPRPHRSTQVIDLRAASTVEVEGGMAALRC